MQVAKQYLAVARGHHRALARRLVRHDGGGYRGALDIAAPLGLATGTEKECAQHQHGSSESGGSLGHSYSRHRGRRREPRRCGSAGSAPLPVDVLERFEQLTGARILEGFGLSETSPVTHANPMHGERKVARSAHVCRARQHIEDADRAVGLVRRIKPPLVAEETHLKVGNPEEGTGNIIGEDGG